MPTLWPHGLHAAHQASLSPSPRACSNSCPLSRWCHPTISSSVISFSSLLQSSPAWGSFPMRELFTSGGQSIGASASASVLPVNIQHWLPLGLTGLISMQSKGLLSLLQHHSSKASILQCPAFFMVQLSYLYMTTGQAIGLIICTFVGKVMPPVFNMLSRFVIAFLPRSKHLLISWLQSPSAVILEPRKIKSVTVSIFSRLFAMKSWRIANLFMVVVICLPCPNQISFPLSSHIPSSAAHLHAFCTISPWSLHGCLLLLFLAPVQM